VKSDPGKLTTEEKLENAIKVRPDYYQAIRDEDGKLVEVHDLNGRIYLKTEKGWAWVD